LFNCINPYKLPYPFFKKIAFAMDAEHAHELTIKTMKVMGHVAPNPKINSQFETSAFGLSFPSPIGLAAGLDKNGEAISFLTSLPFGFVEVGTVTPKAQVGNDKPRLWRYPAEESLRNKMGFNNFGADVLLQNLKQSRRRGKIIGVNLGKNKETKNEEAQNDYASLYRTFAADSDYLVINVSSPNTPGLRDLLGDKGLTNIFEAVNRERLNLKKPLLVKISPDMPSEQLSSVVGLVNEFKLEGIIATNTTIMPARGEGGISGRLLTQKAREVRFHLLKELQSTNSRAELIGVGGITDFNELMDFWKAGGKLAQIYSAFIFKGPDFLYEIEENLKREFKKRGVESFSEFLEAIRK
jgi:dihydroorotate dehydrogenase